MLELKGVSYRYAGYAKSVLQDVDLTLADGEIVGLVGPNEAGKVDALPRGRRASRRRRSRER
jgi:ABC-type multidrug transport system ATPase subunit